MLTNDFEIRVFSSAEQLSIDWPDADDKTGSAFFVFQSKSFIRAWEASYGQKSGVQLSLTEVRQSDGTPLLFLPLSITRICGARVLSFIDEGVSDYNAPIVFPAAAQLSHDAAMRILAAVVAAVPSHDIVALYKMPENVEGLINPLWSVTDRFSDASTRDFTDTSDRRDREIHTRYRQYQKAWSSVAADGREPFSYSSNRS